MALGLRMLAQLHLAFYMGAWDFHSGLHVFKASASPPQSSSSTLFICVFVWSWDRAQEMDLLGKLYAMELHPQLLPLRSRMQ